MTTIDFMDSIKKLEKLAGEVDMMPDLGVLNPEKATGYIYGEEQQALRDLAVGRRVLEIGSFKGLSACLMAPNAINLTCIDLFTCWFGETELLTEFRKNTRHLNNIMVIIGDSKITHTLLPNEHFDMVFIDGDHSYDGCLADLINYWPKLRKGGIMVCHDFNPQYHTGVCAATINFFNRLPDGKVRWVVWWVKPLEGDEVHAQM